MTGDTRSQVPQTSSGFFAVLNHRMRKANRPDKGQVGFRFLNESEHNGTGHNGYRVFVGRRTLTAAQNRLLLRKGLKGMNFLWLGDIIGLQRGG